MRAIIFFVASLLGFLGLGHSTINDYIKPKYDEEGEFLMDYLRHNDFLEEEQEKLPLHSIHTAFKFVTANFNFSRYPENEKNISDGLSEAIAEASEFSVKETKLISVRQYKEGESVVIFGYSRLEDESKAAMFEVELKNGLETGKIGKFTLSRGCIYCKHYRNVHKRNCLYVHIYIFKGVVTNMRGVEANSVIHISIQFWNEPWIYGMDNEKTEIR